MVTSYKTHTLITLLAALVSTSLYTAPFDPTFGYAGKVASNGKTFEELKNSAFRKSAEDFLAPFGLFISIPGSMLLHKKITLQDFQALLTSLQENGHFKKINDALFNFICPTWTKIVNNMISHLKDELKKAVENNEDALDSAFKTFKEELLVNLPRKIALSYSKNPKLFEKEEAFFQRLSDVLENYFAIKRHFDGEFRLEKEVIYSAAYYVITGLSLQENETLTRALADRVIHRGDDEVLNQLLGQELAKFLKNSIRNVQRVIETME